MIDLADAKRAGRSDGEDRARGVHGWLLVFCLMFVVFGPLITLGLMTCDYATYAPSFPEHRGLEVADLVSIVLRTCSVAFGIHAGLRLWAVKPGAVATARLALLFGLAADVITALLLVVAGPTPIVEGRLVEQLVMRVLPDLVFFTLCMGYLNKSSRVEATYGP